MIISILKSRLTVKKAKMLYGIHMSNSECVYVKGTYLCTGGYTFFHLSPSLVFVVLHIQYSRMFGTRTFFLI